MTPNKSLELTMQMQEWLNRDMLQFIEPIFPSSIIFDYQSKSEIKRRDRIFNNENTLLTMILTALQEDKSQTASVHLFEAIFEQNRKKILEHSDSIEGKIQKSKTKGISLNTAAYSKARDRVEQELIDRIFNAIIDRNKSLYRKWHDYTVFNTDGTYLQLQDAEGIPEKYRTQQNSTVRQQGYPQSLLQVLTQQGCGLVHAYKLGSRSDSELSLLLPLIETLPQDALLLADDLYNCYWLMSLLIGKGINFVVPDKKTRKFNILEKRGPGDFIIELEKPSTKNEHTKNAPTSIKMRRIEYPNTQDPRITHVILTTLMSVKFTKEEIVMKYKDRWDTEITIREIKQIMGFAILRSKSEEMIFKEIAVSMIAYNLVRKLIAESVEKTVFSPETDIIQKFFETCTPQLVDSKGRLYSRWAPGRPSKSNSTNSAA